jgi:hypothetical protein
MSEHPISKGMRATDQTPRPPRTPNITLRPTPTGDYNQPPDNPASSVLPHLLFRADFVLFSEEAQYLSGVIAGVLGQRLE